jgi:enoyl-CoA hydratase
LPNVINIAGDTIKTLTVTEPNSLTEEFLQQLRSLLTGGSWGTTRVLILTGSHPEAFLADVSKLQAMAPSGALSFSKLGQEVCAAIESLPFPVIAAIDGMALGGGCELTLACDMVFASDVSNFGQIEVHGGITPGFGGTWRLLRRVGDLKGRELLFTGAILDAKAAAEIGLITEVAPAGQALARAIAVAEAIASNPPLAVRALKEVAIANRSLTLADSNALERRLFSSLFGTEDQKSAMTAFLEKRTVAFTGR